MPYSITRRAPQLGIALGLLLLPTIAEAQIQPGGGMPGGGGMGQAPAEEKKEGVAEAAPKTPGLLPTTPALPVQKGRRKRWKLFEIDGYFRTRTDWFKNFHLGFVDRADLGGAPFPRALSCSSTLLNASCDDTLSSTNMRLRLEPTINLDEGTSVHIQADVLDNVVLGSTPINQLYNGQYNTDDDIFGNDPPFGAFGDGQDPPVAGRNSDRDSIVIKRAWAQVAVPLGILQFGRQPNHWGMGMWKNGGGADPISGAYDYEADYGDSVDRVSFSAVIPGTNLRAMIASDWNMTRLVSNQTVAGFGREGHPWDLDDGDDVNSWVGVISRMDSPQEFKDKVDRGETAFNYGVYFEYKTQEWDLDLTGFEVGGVFDPANRYVQRGMKTYAPDVWAKLGVGSFLLEGEFVAQLGKLDVIEDLSTAQNIQIRKYGGTGRVSWRGLDGKLRIGAESGFASGDQWDNAVEGNTHISNANVLGINANGQSDTRLSQFFFNREYKVDMILWRHLVGAVTNAMYVKPFLGYDLTKSIGFRVANITSGALKPVATPGNSAMYGTEFDADLVYSAGGLTASISYGVLFPFGAMAHPEDTSDASFTYGVDSETGDNNVGEPGTAHTIQMRLVLAF